jgi:hypothetical protein
MARTPVFTGRAASCPALCATPLVTAAALVITNNSKKNLGRFISAFDLPLQNVPEQHFIGKSCFFLPAEA